MLTNFEQNAIASAKFSLESIADSLSEIRKSMKPDSSLFTPEESPSFMMSFDEWASRLELEDRGKLMNFLWNHPDWHKTCLREEDAPWKYPPNESPSEDETADDDLPF